MQKINFVFFGTSEEAVYALEAMKASKFVPSLIVTAPDRPVGRHQEITPPLAKKWAEENFVSTFQPEKIDARAIDTIREIGADVFVVVGYGRILPQKLLDLPKHKTLNIHTSLLPLYRGPTPVQAPILNGDDETGITIMVVDAEVDHGPIVKQEKYALKSDETEPELTKTLFSRGGEMLAEILPEWVAGKIMPEEQSHSKATFTKKLKKEDGEIDLGGDPVKNWRKYRAYIHWPRVFFFKPARPGGGNGKRFIVTAARFESGKFIVEKVIPEGGKEIDYQA